MTHYVSIKSCIEIQLHNVKDSDNNVTAMIKACRNSLHTELQ